MPINQISNNVLFITENTLKTYSVINENVDDKLLKPLIQLVQDVYLTKVLGTSLLVDLQTKIYNGSLSATTGSTLTSDDINLLQVYITPLMVWLVMQEAVVFMTMKFMNKGVQIQNSDNSNPATDNQLQLLSDRAKVFIDSYSERLIKYLIVNRQLYPAYMLYNSYDDIIPTHNGYKPSFITSATGDRRYNYGRNWWNNNDCDWNRYFS